MSKLLQYKIEEASSFFYNNGGTENELYLLNLVLDVGKEYNSLIEEYNILLSKYRKYERTYGRQAGFRQLSGTRK